MVLAKHGVVFPHTRLTLHQAFYKNQVLHSPLFYITSLALLSQTLYALHSHRLKATTGEKKCNPEHWR